MKVPQFKENHRWDTSTAPPPPTHPTPPGRRGTHRGNFRAFLNFAGKAPGLPGRVFKSPAGKRDKKTFQKPLRDRNEPQRLRLVLLFRWALRIGVRFAAPGRLRFDGYFFGVLDVRKPTLRGQSGEKAGAGGTIVCQRADELECGQTEQGPSRHQ